MNINPTSRNSYQINITVDEDGFVHIAEEFPVKGELVIHVSLLAGFAQSVAEQAAHLAAGQKTVQ